MSDCKRSAPTMAAMDSSSSEASISKKRKTSVAAASSHDLQQHLRSSDVVRHQLPDSHYWLFHLQRHTTLSPETSVNSAGTVVSGEFCSDRFPLMSCCSSSNIESGEFVKEYSTTKPVDPELLQTKGFEPVDSTYNNFKSFSSREKQYSLSEFSGDSEESTMFPPAVVAEAEQRKCPAVTVKMPPKDEIEEFFAMAEKYEQKRFAEKYNFDIVKDMPLEGRYQWVRLH